jgi:uncharacterized protein
MEQNQSFLGTGWAFPPSFNTDSGTVDLVSDAEDIDQSLNILLSTSIGERIMQPLFGSSLENYIFEPLNSSVIGYIKDVVQHAILFFEPRIIAERIEVTAAGSVDLMEGRFTISIDYIIPEANSRFNYVYDYYLNEAVRTA